jgi:hypothetical protein
MTAGTTIGQLKRENGINPSETSKALRIAVRSQMQPAVSQNQYFSNREYWRDNSLLTSIAQKKFAVIAHRLSELFQIISIGTASLASRDSNSRNMVALSSENESFGVRHVLDNPSLRARHAHNRLSKSVLDHLIYS